MRAKLLHRANKQLDFQGIPIVLEYSKGDTRKGSDRNGKEWSRQMVADYGYITDYIPENGDKENLDVYIGDDPEAENAYIIEQLTDEGEFDEFKVILGEHSENEARDLYLAHYPAGWETHIGSIFPVPVARLREYVEGKAND